MISTQWGNLGTNMNNFGDSISSSLCLMSNIMEVSTHRNKSCICYVRGGQPMVHQKFTVGAFHRFSFILYAKQILPLSLFTNTELVVRIQKRCLSCIAHLNSYVKKLAGDMQQIDLHSPLYQVLKSITRAFISLDISSFPKIWKFIDYFLKYAL